MLVRMLTLFTVNYKKKKFKRTNFGYSPFYYTQYCTFLLTIKLNKWAPF